MGNEIQLVSDGDGLAVIGDPTAVERFLVARGRETALTVADAAEECVGSWAASVSNGQPKLRRRRGSWLT